MHSFTTHCWVFICEGLNRCFQHEWPHGSLSIHATECVSDMQDALPFCFLFFNLPCRCFRRSPLYIFVVCLALETRNRAHKASFSPIFPIPGIVDARTRWVFTPIRSTRGPAYKIAAPLLRVTCLLMFPLFLWRYPNSSPFLPYSPYFWRGSLNTTMEVGLVCLHMGDLCIFSLYVVSFSVLPLVHYSLFLFIFRMKGVPHSSLPVEQVHL